MVSILFCKGLHWTERLLDRGFRSPWVRVLAGSVLLIGMSLLTNGDYNGAGMDVITRALAGEASGWAWLLKILFTAVTIGCGFKGGEVVPSFFVGAAFGCFMGGLLGLPAGFGGAIGLVAVFCGAVNCPVASVLLSVELFGSARCAVFCRGLRPELSSLRLLRLVQQPDHPLFQAPCGIYQRPHPRVTKT